MARSKRKRRGRRKPTRVYRSHTNGRRTRPRDSLKLAIVLTALTTVLLAITIFGIVASVQQHGHVHLNLAFLLLDGMAGLFAAIEWTEWIRHR